MQYVASVEQCVRAADIYPDSSRYRHRHIAPGRGLQPSLCGLRLAVRCAAGSSAWAGRAAHEPCHAACDAVERTTQPMFFVARPAGQGVAPRRALEYRDEEECPQVLVDMLNGPDGDLFQALEGNNMNTYCTLAGRQVPPSHSRWQGLSAPVRASLQPQPSHRTLPPLPRLDN